MQQHLIAREDRVDSFGTLLKQWRTRRNFSQLDLAVNSEVSQRHISFLESGRAQPSQAMVLQLATVLEIPLRQQNLLLSAAGFAPIHTETDLSAPEMAPVRKALDLMLQKHEPYPAFAVDRYWNLLLTNQGATRLLAAFIAPDRLHRLFYTDGKINLLRVLFHPHGLRPFVVNWESIASHVLQRLEREMSVERESDFSTGLMNELMSDPDVAAAKRKRRERIWQIDRDRVQHTLLLNTHFQREDLELKFFSTIATLGTPDDITLQELRLECLFPADEATERDWQQLSETSAGNQ